MKKSIKIILIVIPIVLIVAGASTFVGTLLYTKNNVTYEVGDAKVTNFIQEIIIPTFPIPTIEYIGYIVTAVPFEIVNNGLYNIKDLVISLKVYGQNFTLSSSLNEKLLGQGENTIGDVPKGEIWTGELEINMTLSIVLLAIQDGELRIEANISLSIDFLIYAASVIFEDTQIEVWDSPF
ncbi:MAG TPA: hypothetical protein VMX55_06900 [candidate division Zixibacteria bacterium]|nr:hypothetical protein [candidate division Zixibacteria bacterium]